MPSTTFKQRTWISNWNLIPVHTDQGIEAGQSKKKKWNTGVISELISNQSKLGKPKICHRLTPKDSVVGRRNTGLWWRKITYIYNVSVGRHDTYPSESKQLTSKYVISLKTGAESTRIRQSPHQTGRNYCKVLFCAFQVNDRRSKLSCCRTELLTLFTSPQHPLNITFVPHLDHRKSCLQELYKWILTQGATNIVLCKLPPCTCFVVLLKYSLLRSTLPVWINC